jgi:cyclopropane fatty-acyl-phospholipid synthase-like methyltransferase
MGFAGQEAFYSEGDADPTYLDIQAATGVTKHSGGYSATDELYRLCHLDEAREVLEVGCGIGVGPVYVARRFDCQIVAVDISDKMLAWSRQRAQREGVADRITFRRADVRDLPLEDDRFDAVVAESVLAFVADKETAIQELVRVTKPGGYVGLNEVHWTREPTEDLRRQSASLGTAVITEGEWWAIWNGTSLVERTMQSRRLDARQEVRDRVAWIGWRSILAAWGRMLKLLITDLRVRTALRAQAGGTTQYVGCLGYGLLVGRKPLPAAEA